MNKELGYILRFIIVIIVCLMTTTISAKKKIVRGAQGQMVVMTDSLAEDEMELSDSLSASQMSADSLLMSTMTAPLLTKQDSATLKAMEQPIKQKRDWTKWKPDPTRALWLALVIPGAGQIYNRKFWKLPIVYGGFIGCAYAMRWNNQMYLDYSQAYLDLMDDDPETRSYDQFLHLGAKIDASNQERYKQIFKNRKDRYRRWRDLSFFVMLGVYALSVIDAYVDAHLAQFDISDDLSLRLEPAVIGGPMRGVSNAATPAASGVSTNGIGVHGTLTF